VAGLPPTATARPLTRGINLLGASAVAALVAVFAIPQIDHAVTHDPNGPGLISFLGVGLSVLGLTAMFLFLGMRQLLPRTVIFVAAALGYNALLIAIKFGLGPYALYDANARGFNNGFQFLTAPLAYPGLAAITALLYAGGFMVIYLIYRSRAKRLLGLPVGISTGVLQLFVVMFVLAVVGGVTAIGLLGFLEYTISVFFGSVMGLSIAASLVLAIVLCSVAFREAADQAVVLRNVTVLSTFAWIGLAFIAAYHILWLVFLLTLISIWPLHAWTGK
jgi:hypothetical protein